MRETRQSPQMRKPGVKEIAQLTLLLNDQPPDTMNKYLVRLLLIAATGGCFATAADTSPQQDRERLEQTLAAKDFWAQPTGASWTPREVALLSQLAVSSFEPAVRLRATKLIIELAGNGHATPQQTALVTAAFRYLEEHTDQPAIARLLAGPPLTHYTVSTKDDGSLWVLLESTAVGANRGGINLRWDASSAQIVSLDAWGGLAAK